MIKRMVCVLLIGLMLLSPISSFAAAEPQLAMSVPSGDYKIGDTLEVVVSAQNMPACASMELLFQYDTQALKPTAYAKGNLSGLFLCNLNYTIKETDSAELAGEKGVKVVGASSNNNALFSGDLMLVTLAFEVIGAPAKESGAEIRMLNYSFSQNDTDLTKVTGMTPPEGTLSIPFTAIEVTTLPTKTTYLEKKDALDLGGGKLSLIYSAEVQKEIDLAEATVSGFDNTLVGAQTLTATYQGFTATFNVTIQEKSIASIAVTTLPEKIEYLEKKDAFDPAGGKITVTYDNDDTAEIALGEATISGFDNTLVGAQTLTATYQGFTAQFNVTIKEKSMASIAVTTLPAKTVYLEKKDAFDPAGGKITVTYDNDDTAEINLAEATVSGFNNTLVGAQTLTATYQGFTATFNVTIQEKSMASIAVTTLPEKIEYLEGKDLFDPAGGKITVTYDNDDTAEIDLGEATISGFDNTLVGEQTLTATYQGFTATFNVTIQEKAVERIELTAPAKRIYWQGEGLDFVGSTAIVYYNNGTQQPMAPASMAVSGFHSNAGGEQTVTLTYGGKTAEFTVTVLEKHPFTDISDNSWYYTNQSVPYVYTHGLMNGMTATTFGGEGETTRAQLVTILWRLEGKPRLSGDDGFSDIAPADWYYEAVLWASKSGIVTGYPDGTFAPDQSVSRAEMAVIFYRYTKDYKGLPAVARADLGSFADRAEIAPWCTDAIAWAVAEGLMTGMPGNLFAPSGTANRAQIATVLMRYVERNRK